MTVIVITGSRDWTDRVAIERLLAGADMLIVGDCPTGADAIALEIAKAWDVIPVVLKADWSLGKKAGPIRNQAIAKRAVLARDEGGDVYCYALPLPGSTGTHDCKRRLETAGFGVEVVTA